MTASRWRYGRRAYAKEAGLEAHLTSASDTALTVRRDYAVGVQVETIIKRSAVNGALARTEWRESERRHHSH
jgi:hypothetical protein